LAFFCKIPLFEGFEEVPPNFPLMKKTSNFQLRAMISVLLALAFPALLVSGLVLFVSPPGRVANWTDWRLFGLSKHA